MKKRNGELNRKVHILGIIPARGGSKGILRKNIAPLAGRPLMYYTVREARKSRLLDAVIVSTDDPGIARVAKSMGADVPFLRPKKYARDTSRDIDYLKHAVEWLERHRGWTPDIVVNLQPTSPGRTGRDIDTVLRFMIRTGCDSVRTFVDSSLPHPLKMWIQPDPNSSKLLPILALTPYRKLGADVPRQLLPRHYQPVGLVYATRTKFIKRGKVWGSDVRAYMMDSKKYVDIDTPRDLKAAEETLKKLKFI